MNVKETIKHIKERIKSLYEDRNKYTEKLVDNKKLSARDLEKLKEIDSMISANEHVLSIVNGNSEDRGMFTDH